MTRKLILLFTALLLNSLTSAEVHYKRAFVSDELMSEATQIVQQSYISNLKVNFQSVILGLKGFLSGAQKGLLNDEESQVDPACFSGERANEQMQFISKFLNKKRDIAEVLDFVTTVVDLVNTQAELCGYTGNMKMLQEYCHEHVDIESNESEDIDPYYYVDEIEEEGSEQSQSGAYSFDDSDLGPLKRPSTRCSQKSIVQNFYGRIFNFIGIYQRAALLSSQIDFTVQSGIEIYLQCLGVGREMGTAVRILFDFRPEFDMPQ